MNKTTPATLLLAAALLAAASADDSAELEAARSLAAQGDPAAALSVVEEPLAADAEMPEALFLQGVLLVELRRADEARAVFERLIEVEPDLPEPYNNLAVIEAAAGDYESAVKTLRRALQTHASYRTADAALTEIYTQLASEAYSQALDSEATSGSRPPGARTRRASRSPRRSWRLRSPRRWRRADRSRRPERRRRRAAP